MPRIRPWSRSAPLAALCLASLLFSSPALAADAKKAAAPVAKPKADAMATPAGLEIPGLPRYTPPAAYSVDMVINADGKDMTMKRSIDNGRMRTDITAEGQAMSMIELGDERGTTLMIMPEQKMVMKQSRASMEEAMKKVSKAHAAEAQAKTDGEAEAVPEMKIEVLGDDTIDGQAAKKIRMVTDQGPVFGWFDKGTGAPLRFEAKVEGKTSTISWKNMKVGPQPASLFEAPKGYEVQDMDEMMKKMGGMGMGMGSVAGMAGSMAGGMAAGYASNVGSSMGAQFGGALGMSLGGPIGAIAGQYIGGKVGGMIGHKAADMVIPGKQ